jgi:NADH-quinone oxidoreductase subunit A
MEALLSIVLFAALGGAFVFVNMAIGSLARPKLPNPEKLEAYECGERPIGDNWVQFDLRFYIVALVYLVFAVEIALFYPWAVAWGDAVRIARESGLPDAFAVRQVALVDMLFFFGVLLVGFAYLWRFGYLDWIHSTATNGLKVEHGAGADLSKQARVDPVS